MMKRVVIAVVWILGLHSAEAQFQKEQQAAGQQADPRAQGQAMLRQQQQQQAQGSIYANRNRPTGIVLTDGAKEVGAGVGQMSMATATIWARSIEHPDGTWTESNREGLRDKEIEQLTMSSNGVLLKRRLITLDASGRPSEVLIYRGKTEFRYRGLLLYDEKTGAFIEEQLYDRNDKIVRRKIQEYKDGKRLPMRSVYVKDVPEDLQIVVTQQERDPSQPGQEIKPFEGAREVPVQKENGRVLKRLFNKNKQK